MARMSRAEVFAADEIGLRDWINGTGRRWFLLGDDLVFGQNYDHRKVWIDERLVLQAPYFGIDLLWPGYSVASRPSGVAFSSVCGDGDRLSNDCNPGHSGLLCITALHDRQCAPDYSPALSADPGRVPHHGGLGEFLPAVAH